MVTRLLKFVLLNLCLVFVFSVHAQKHEVGVNGGWLSGYPYGKSASSVMQGGWSAGGYYRYTLNKWIGAESGLEYTRKKYDFAGDVWENSLSIPLNVVVFPKFRFSLFGGIYFRNRLGKKTVSVGHKPMTNEEIFLQVEKSPVWGYAAGVKWNMKYCRLVFSCKQDMNSWLKNFDRMWHSIDEKAPKSFSLNITAEIPLWRNKKKHEVQ